jgi:dihydrofolate reductase
MIKGIVAIAQNYAIGKDGKLPWHFSNDLKFFKATTTNNAIAMGANTWRSIGKPLPNRLNIVLSRASAIETQPNLVLTRSKDEVLALANFLKCDLFIIGGAKTFESFADVIDEWIVTRIPLTIEEPDVSMPQDFLKGLVAIDAKDIGEGLKVEVFRRERN